MKLSRRKRHTQVACTATHTRRKNESDRERGEKDRPIYVGGTKTNVCNAIALTLPLNRNSTCICDYTARLLDYMNES